MLFKDLKNGMVAYCADDPYWGWGCVPAGESVKDGLGGYETAPSAPGNYRLWAVLYADTNTFSHFEWEKVSLI